MSCGSTGTFLPSPTCHLLSVAVVRLRSGVALLESQETHRFVGVACPSPSLWLWSEAIVNRFGHASCFSSWTPTSSCLAPLWEALAAVSQLLLPRQRLYCPLASPLLLRDFLSPSLLRRNPLGCCFTSRPCLPCSVATMSKARSSALSANKANAPGLGYWCMQWMTLVQLAGVNPRRSSRLVLCQQRVLPKLNAAARPWTLEGSKEQASKRA